MIFFSKQTSSCTEDQIDDEQTLPGVCMLRHDVAHKMTEISLTDGDKIAHKHELQKTHEDTEISVLNLFIYIRKKITG